MAQVFVKEVLKAPSTAQFETYRNNLVQDLGNNRYQINSYVDSQNSFGAMLRAKYSIIIVRQFSHNWVVESLVFDGKVIK
jgi:hypothetical protein